MVEEELVKQRFFRNLPNIQTQISEIPPEILNTLSALEKNDALNLEDFSKVIQYHFDKNVI